MRHSVRLVPFFLSLSLLVPFATSARADSKHPKLDSLTQERVSRGQGWSHVVITAVDSTIDSALTPIIQRAGGTQGRKLSIINARAAYLPNAAITALADDPLVSRVSNDRLVFAANERTSTTVGAAAVRQQLGYDGAGVGVAIIDSGVAVSHDDLRSPSGGQRIVRFVDLVQGQSTPYDGYGHGTHVAGIVAGNGFDSSGARAGIAPGAHLVVIKALDSGGVGRISDVIGALDYVVGHKNELNIRVVNLSVGAGVFESYDTDPLTRAAKRAVDTGIVVVAAAGNAGRDSQGRRQYGGIQAPGNAPWVLTVGAASHMGTVDRLDDTVAVFSSRGPSPIDYRAKPDVVAPGVGIESLSDPLSEFYTTRSAYLLNGTVPTSYLPYLSLTGTSMATPVVTGAVALMIQANPSLTPNQVKAILQYTSQVSPAYDPLTQGVGFINARGAVDLARFLLAPTGAYPLSSEWAARLIWGNQLVQGGILTSHANAWATDVVWGAATTPVGQTVEWGLTCRAKNCASEQKWEAWGAQCTNAGCTTVSWDGGYSFNVVWGAQCGGADCGVGGSSEGETVVWGSTDDETVVWGSNEGETVVWGSDDSETVVWGSDEYDTVVWGSSCTDAACEPVIWKKGQ